jgi:hypothetical protein
MTWRLDWGIGRADGFGAESGELGIDWIGGGGRWKGRWSVDWRTCAGKGCGMLGKAGDTMMGRWLMMTVDEDGGARWTDGGILDSDCVRGGSVGGMRIVGLDRGTEGGLWKMILKSLPHY